MRALAMAILLVTIEVAHADPKVEAQAALERGVAAYRGHDLIVAQRELTAARALSPESPNPHRWLAIVERDLGHCKVALVHVESFLARVPTGDGRIAELVELRNKCVVELTAAQEPPPRTAAPAPPPPVEASSRWWLWTAIGIGVVASLGATYVFVVRDDGPAMLAPVTCNAAGCK